MPIIKDYKKAKKKIENIASRFDINNRKKELQVVEGIVEDVRNNGDKALLKYTKLFDKIQLKTIQVDQKLIKASTQNISKKLLSSIKKAIVRIRKFQSTNIPTTWIKSFNSREKLGYRYTSLDSVGVYIPGGKIPLISTVLMTVIPAQVAGVQRIVVFTPPPVNNGILAACNLLGIKEIYQLGGAQAVAAACYGSKTIKSVNKIVGPGNIYVTLAKKTVFGKIGIDGLYGPSEIAVLADSSGNPEYIANDLLSQLEHGSGLESAVLITTNTTLANKVDSLVRQIGSKLPNANVVLNSWENNSAIIVVNSMMKAVELINNLAPEHLEIIAKDSLALSRKINNAGAIFIGENSCESIGDYIAGPSHCLPTGGSAKFSSGLTVMDFMKKISIVSFTKASLVKVANDVIEIAEAECLPAHANAIRVRMGQNLVFPVK